jgi:hypothetical protein
VVKVDLLLSSALDAGGQIHTLVAPHPERKPVLTEQEAEWPAEFNCTFWRIERFLDPAGIRTLYCRLAAVITSIIYTQLLRIWNSAKLTEIEELQGSVRGQKAYKNTETKNDVAKLEISHTEELYNLFCNNDH